MRRAAVLASVLAWVSATGPASAQPTRAPGSAESLQIEPPHRLDDAEVRYPEGANGDATVIVVLVVGDDGVVREALPETRTEPFASAAAAAVRTWRFEPATRGGKPIVAKIKVEVAFHAPVVTETPPADEGAVEAPAPAPPGAAGARPALPPNPAPRPDEVRVRGAREPGRTVSLSRTEVRQIPGAFGDPFRAVEVMPGVTPIVSGLPFFYGKPATHG